MASRMSDDVCESQVLPPAPLAPDQVGSATLVRAARA